MYADGVNTVDSVFWLLSDASMGAAIDFIKAHPESMYDVLILSAGSKTSILHSSVHSSIRPFVHSLVLSSGPIVHSPFTSIPFTRTTTSFLFCLKTAAVALTIVRFNPPTAKKTSGLTVGINYVVCVIPWLSAALIRAKAK